MRGYDVTTNREIATRAGITSGALYHYFPSKLELYLAVYAEVQSEILVVLEEAIVSASSFVERFEKILDATLEMNRRDPSVARFNGAVRVDARHHSDISAALAKRHDPVVAFFEQMIADAVDTEEIAGQDVPLVEAFVLTVLLGITAAMSTDLQSQQNANEAIKRLMHGRLL
jgi:AcrR family transcriptional regulator